MIGTLNESPLHRALKGHYVERLECAVAEAPVGDYVADVLDGQQIYEIQTSGLGAMRHKLEQLLVDFRVVVVHPIASASVIVKLSRQADGTFSRRRSPKKGQLLNLLDELVSIPELLQHPNFELEVVLVEQELVREYACAMRRGRGGWRTIERRLLNLISVHRFRCCDDLWSLMQEELVETFGTAEIAQALGSDRAMAQKFAYCMRLAGEIEVVGKQGNSLLYERSATDPSRRGATPV